jgi:RNA-directed DNA polymerase
MPSRRGAVLAERIREEAQKLIRRHQRYAADLHDELVRRHRRSGVGSPKDVKVPAYWRVSDGFDPYKTNVRARGIAYAIETALQAGTYRPRPAVEYRVPKGIAEWRSVSVFQVADNALSRKVYKSLIEKNAPRLSGRCYAYRNDITIHDAVAYIASEFRSGARLYVAEFDFRKFFDSLSHDHFERVLTDDAFLITDRERLIVRAFLRAPSLPLAEYDERSTRERERGMPQGTSISLFLANAAASVLDRKLERLGIGFVRYADDTLIWSNDYAEVCRAVDALIETARLMGVELNFDKSDGISILAASGEPAEFRAKTAVDFVGYAIHRDRISIKARKVEEIKERVSYLIYSNLLQPLARGQIVPARFAPLVDRDYVVAVTQVRRYLYGDLSESRLKMYLARVTPRIRYRGLMSFYPIVDDEDLMKQLDGWLAHTMWCALRKRARLLRTAGHANLPPPHGQTPAVLKDFWGMSSQSGKGLDLRLPSFVRISRLLRKASRAYGPNATANPLGYYKVRAVRP